MENNQELLHFFPLHFYHPLKEGEAPGAAEESMSDSISDWEWA